MFALIDAFETQGNTNNEWRKCDIISFKKKSAKFKRVTSAGAWATFRSHFKGHCKYNLRLTSLVCSTVLFKEENAITRFINTHGIRVIKPRRG